MMINRQSGRWTGLYFASWLTLFSWCRLHFKLRDLYLFKAPFSSLCLTESLIFLSFIHKPQDTLVLSNPSHHCPFISPPAEFIILDFIIPPSPLQVIVFCALKDRGPSILSQYLRHYVFPSINFFLALPLSPYPLPSLAVHQPRALFPPVIYTFPRQYVLLIQRPALGTASLQGGRDTRGHTWLRQRGIQSNIEFVRINSIDLSWQKHIFGSVSFQCKSILLITK